MSDTSYQQYPAAQQPVVPDVYQPNQRAEGVPAEGLRGRFWPDGDQEWKFEGNIQDAPDWVDKGWASYDQGPAVAVPVGNPLKQPYTTIVARKGDTIKYVARKNGMFGKFIVEKAVLIDDIENAERGTKRPAQESQASLEDLLTSGYAKPEDLDSEAKAQVRVRSPDVALSGVLGDEDNPQR